MLKLQTIVNPFLSAFQGISLTMHSYNIPIVILTLAVFQAPDSLWFEMYYWITCNDFYIKTISNSFIIRHIIILLFQQDLQ